MTAAVLLLQPLLSGRAAGAPPAAPTPSVATTVGLTVAAARKSLRGDLKQLQELQGDLIELQSCLAVDTPPNCIASWPQLRLRLLSAAAACDRLRAAAPVVGAAIAEQRPGARSGLRSLFELTFEGLVGRQVTPADLDYMERVEAAAVALDDVLLEAKRLLAEASASFQALEEGSGALALSLKAVQASATLLLDGGAA